MKRIPALVVVVGVLVVSCTPALRSREIPLSYRQAEDAFRLGDYERAARAYRVFLKSEQRKDLVPRAYYRLALSHFRLKQYEASIDVLRALRERYPKERWPQVPMLRGDIEHARDNVISALYWWDQALAEAEDDQRALIFQRMREAASRMGPETLEAARKLLSTPEGRKLLRGRLREVRGDTTADLAEADEVAPAMVEEELPQDGAPPVAGVTPTADPNELPPGVKPRIACLLPLSGPYAAYGESSLRAIRLAAANSDIEVVEYDTQGNPSLARRLFDEMVGRHEILAVVGPLRSEVAAELAPLAEKAGMPMFLLSQRQGLTGRFVMQVALTPTKQAETIADYACAALGIQRAGILYPNDPYGTTLMQEFRTAFEKKGGKVVGTQAYQPGAQEFGVEALSVQKWIQAEALQAVFLPDFAETVNMLAAELQRTAPYLVLLGADGWYDAGGPSVAGPALQGAVFVDGFFERSTRPGTRAFVASFEATHRRPPGILEAQAFDAATLALAALRNGARSRQSVHPTLRRLAAIAGASGAIRIGPDGINREVFLLTVDQAGVREIAAAHLPH